MENKRKYNRIPFKVTLLVDCLFKQDNTIIDGLDAEIVVQDVSHRGIGFLSKADLPIDFYFNAEISFGEDKRFLTVLRILRKAEIEYGYNYGCEFVGLADNLADMITEYAEAESQNQ